MKLDLSSPPRQSPTQSIKPAWWLASGEDFARVSLLRSEIHQHDQAFAKSVKKTLMGILACLLALHVANATGAVAMPGDHGFMNLLTLVVVTLAGTWLVDRRLKQQIGDTALRVCLWRELVAVVRHGDPARAMPVARSQERAPVAASLQETALEKLLKKEVAAAENFVAANGSLEPYLPLQCSCFKLRKVAHRPTALPGISPRG